jgi:DNA-binding GntR family transcriptional regulator
MNPYPLSPDDFEMPRSRTLADQALAGLREGILSGRLAPGSALSLKAMAEWLGMSPTPIREALQKLALEGLVDLDSFKGARVAPLSVDHVRDLYSWRILIEVDAVRRAVPNVTDEAVEAATRCLKAYGEAYAANRPDIARHRHRDLHFALYAANHTQWISRLVDPLWQNSERYQRIASSMRGSGPDLVAEHQVLIDAWVSRDPERAAAAMADHLKRSVDLIVNYLENNK